MPAALPPDDEFRAAHALARAVQRGDCWCLGNGRYYPTWINPATGQSERLSQLICRVFHGKKPSRKAVTMHSCDNKACIWPAHVGWGTQSRNIKDAVHKGRVIVPARPDQLKLLAEGKHNWAKLKPDEVLAIRARLAMSEIQASIAHDFGVSFQQISKIKRGQRWSHVA